jgi:hypothetical protein
MIFCTKKCAISGLFTFALCGEGASIAQLQSCDLS